MGRPNQKITPYARNLGSHRIAAPSATSSSAAPSVLLPWTAAAPATSTESPPSSAAEAIDGKPTVLGAAGLTLLPRDAPRTLIVRSWTKVGRHVFEGSGGRLCVLGSAGAGSTTVDLAAATDPGCFVVNVPNVPSGEDI